MPVTTLLLLTVGLVITSGLGYAFLSARAFDRKHPQVEGPKAHEPARS